jgi:hypothetical protein
VFSKEVSSQVPVDAAVLASLQRHFNFDVETIFQHDSEETTHNNTVTQSVSRIEFNLFSTGTAPAKVSLVEQSYEVPLVNRIRPREYYFIDPYDPLCHQLKYRNDKIRKTNFSKAVITGSQILEHSQFPYVSHFFLD